MVRSAPRPTCHRRANHWLRAGRPPGVSPMERYDRRFFEAQRDGARRSARRTVPLLVELIHPKSVVDVGCGVGSWLSVFREFGIENVLGVDGGEEVELLEIPPECFVTHDLTTPIVLDREFELVVSLEVAEHLPPESSDA